MIIFDAPQVWPGRVRPTAHLISTEGPAELAAFAAKLVELRPTRLQFAGTWKEHYDIGPREQARAVQAGAKQVDRLTFVNALRHKRGDRSCR